MLPRLFAKIFIKLEDHFSAEVLDKMVERKVEAILDRLSVFTDKVEQEYILLRGTKK